MKYISLIVFVIFAIGCKTVAPTNVITTKQESEDQFRIAFGSCYDANKKCPLWPHILNSDPDVWVWGGDIVYADTDDMEILSKEYQKLATHSEYKKLKKQAKIMATWDDHDYGLNDGGIEFEAKEESKQEFLNFMEVDKNNERRTRDGVYYSEVFKIKEHSVKIIVLDTRYNRTALTPSEIKGKRYQPNTYGEGTILGETQWNWLINELDQSTSDFNIIVSSIQVLSGEHGYESWANFPHEVDKLEKTIRHSRAKGVMIISGDRHISEVSSKPILGNDFPLIDFTSSGMTHSYDKFKSEENKYRVGEVFQYKSYGVIDLNLKSKVCTFNIIDKNGKVFQSIIQKY